MASRTKNFFKKAAEGLLIAAAVFQLGSCSAIYKNLKAVEKDYWKKTAIELDRATKPPPSAPHNSFLAPYYTELNQAVNANKDNPDSLAVYLKALYHLDRAEFNSHSAAGAINVQKELDKSAAVRKWGCPCPVENPSPKRFDSYKNLKEKVFFQAMVPSTYSNPFLTSVYSGLERAIETNKENCDSLKIYGDVLPYLNKAASYFKYSSSPVDETTYQGFLKGTFRGDIHFQQGAANLRQAAEIRHNPLAPRFYIQPN